MVITEVGSDPFVGGPGLERDCTADTRPLMLAGSHTSPLSASACALTLMSRNASLRDAALVDARRRPAQSTMLMHRTERTADLVAVWSQHGADLALITALIGRRYTPATSISRVSTKFYLRTRSRKRA
jgi:hypothetical protein